MTSASETKDGIRDCANCKHHVIRDTILRNGEISEHIRGCEVWDCEFEPKEEVEDGND